MALSEEQKQKVRETVRESLEGGPMYFDELVDKVVAELDLESERRAVAMVAWHMTEIIDGGPHDGKVRLREDSRSGRRSQKRRRRSSS